MVADSGTSYQLVTFALQNDKQQAHLRACVAVDDSGRRAYFPLVGSFSVAPDGSFIGE